ncbi:MAG: undecaprenyl-diphosphate phosphatase [Phycisphaerales bacterium]|nr:MAG: undecaprenyl-diphosphate phosphatase [Phycisphaerales bacterium]
MSELDYLRAVVLGVVQGLTEFLPVSSSGHLAIVQRYFALDANSSAMLLFDVLAHFGTLVAVLIVFAASVKRFMVRIIRETRTSWRGRRYAWRIVLLAVVAMIPTTVMGLTLQDTFESAFDKPLWIGTALVVTGILLALTTLLNRPSRGWGRFSFLQAFVVGIAQGCAILPGISRSGATICVASFCGLRRRWAAEFSFLIAVPAIVGATLIKMKDTFELPVEELSAVAWGPVIVGSIVSLIVGAVALLILLDMVRRSKLHYFAIYCWVIGALLLAGVVG